MAQLFEHLIPVLIVLYFAISTAVAVLRRMATPERPWPVEPRPPEPAGEGSGGEKAREAVPATPPARKPPEERARPVQVEAPAPPETAGSPDELSDLPLSGSFEEEWSAFAREAFPLGSAAPGRARSPRRRREALRRKLREGGLRDAVLLAEVVGPPRALRPYAPPPLVK